MNNRLIVKFVFFLICFISFGIDLSISQEFDSTYYKLMQKYNLTEENFEVSNQKTINFKIIDADKKLISALNTDWKLLNQSQILSPIQFPEIKKITIKQNKKEIADNEIKYIIYKPDYKYKNNFYTPVKLFKEENYIAQNTLINFAFYNTKIDLEYDKVLNSINLSSIDSLGISDYYTRISKTDYSTLIYQLLDYKSILNLPDWGYLMLVQQFSDKIYSASNEANLLTWFLMLKSGYKVKIAYNSTGVFVLVGSSNTIYNLQFIDIKEERYYMREQNTENLKTYNGNYDFAEFFVNLNIDKSLNLNEITEQREINFTYKDSDYVFTFEYNKNLIDFYNDYPQSDFSIYFNSTVSSTLKQSLNNQFSKHLKNKTEKDEVDFILQFVQNGFNYKDDFELFENEKYLFPEEIFAFEYSDSEDRTILFNYLIKELLNIEVVGLNFQTHIASAVNFTENISGNYLIYNNKRFTICDPTYVNSEVGAINKKYLTNQVELIEIENEQYLANLSENIWNTLQDIGIKPYDNNQNIVFDSDENYYITGYFENSVFLNSEEIISVDKKSDFIVAKFNKLNELQWFNSFGIAGNDYGISLNIDENNFCYVTGLYSSQFTQNNTTLKVSENNEVFVAKLNYLGNIEWINKLGVDTVSFDRTFVYVSKFRKSGEFISTEIFTDSEYFSDYQINVDEDICTITGIINKFGVEESAFALGESRTIINSSSEILKNWLSEKNGLINMNYQKSVAGLFAFLKALENSGNLVAGTQATEIITQNNPNMKKNSPELYLSISNIDNLKNSGGIITFTTKDKKSITLDDIIIENDAKISLSTTKGGNTKINVISGIYFENEDKNLTLNSLKILVLTGDIVIDYDTDNSIKTKNIDSDFLKK